MFIHKREYQTPNFERNRNYISSERLDVMNINLIKYRTECFRRLKLKLTVTFKKKINNFNLTPLLKFLIVGRITFIRRLITNKTRE